MHIVKLTDRAERPAYFTAMTDDQVRNSILQVVYGTTAIFDTIDNARLFAKDMKTSGQMAPAVVTLDGFIMQTGGGITRRINCYST
jgi:hypothetical protein